MNNYDTSDHTVENQLPLYDTVDNKKVSAINQMQCNDDIKLVSDHENLKNSHRIRKQVNKTYRQKCVVNFNYPAPARQPC